VNVGIVSGFFHDHSIWKIPTQGWLSQLDRNRFRLFGYYSGTRSDRVTSLAAELCRRFVRGPLSVERWRTTILADKLHVLIYPEIGMDSMAAQLAAQRLAPVQCNGMGHPITSGFPTIDYCLSSDLMEPPNAEKHYTEQLIRLPNISVHYEPLQTEPVLLTRSELGLRSSSTVYWSGQSLFKYLPQFDLVFPRIARQVGDCQFIFIEHAGSTHLTELFRKRLHQTFAAIGLNAVDYCVFLPRLDQHRFMAAVGQCDVFLNTIGWSGFNSVMESLPHNLPVVTMTGPFMRSQHAVAILRMLNVTDTIASSIDDYVSIAVRLGQDVPWRMAIKSRIAEHKHRLYRDETCISALEEFLESVARDARPASSR
jgi:predicted O-linked N-acetylglucosamine transferase (SPINDLY family)